MRLVLGALLALALAAPAAAQQPPADETPVVGGGSFNSAPILQPGKYRDTVLPGEYLYYAVKVQPGQRVHLIGHTDLSDADLIQLAIPAVYVTIQSPTRMDMSPSGSGTVQGNIGTTGGADFVGPTTPATDDTDTEGPWAGAGVHFISVQAVWRGGTSAPPKAEIPFHLEISLEGAAQARQAPAATATPTPTATATAAPGSGSKQGNGAAVAAGAGVGGLLIGVVAGIFMRRNRR